MEAERSGAIVQSDQHFVAQLEAVKALEAPLELSDFHSAWVSLYEEQVQVLGANTVVIGPNPATQAAYERWLSATAAMAGDLRLMLRDVDCLDREIINYAFDFIEARQRMATIEPGRVMTAEEYGQGCGDILLSAPTLTSMTGLADYLKEQWGRLTPPTELQGYHDIVFDFYQSLAETGEFGSQPKFYAALTAEVETIPNETIAIMGQWGCTT